MSLPEAIIPLLVQFEPLFTQPTWRKALLPHAPRKTPAPSPSNLRAASQGAFRLL
jgi:hypothetical protein